MGRLDGKIPSMRAPSRSTGRGSPRRERQRGWEPAVSDTPHSFGCIEITRCRAHGPPPIMPATRSDLERAMNSPVPYRESGPAGPSAPRLLDRVRAAVRIRHYSRRTEKAYVAWIRRFILFHGKRHPADMSAPELTQFLNSLAVDGHVAASTQNQALRAAIPVPRRTRSGCRLARRHRAGKAAAAATDRPDSRGSASGAPGVARCPAAHGMPALRLRPPSARVLPAARPGRRLRRQSDRGSRRQGQHGPRDRVAFRGRAG